MNILKKLWGGLTAYPDSWDDYFPVGRWLIYKRLPLLLLALALIAGAVLWYCRPAPSAGIPVFEEGSAGLPDYSGEAILTRKGAVVYRGPVQAGLRSGTGRAFAGDAAKTLVYEGSFLLDKYDGAGKLYDKGALLYEGTFRSGLWDGEGTLYQGEQILYQGRFAKGGYDGFGTLYENGRKRYEGAFQNGLFDGEGTLYGPDGVVYTGGFRRGLYDGLGLELAPGGVKRYEGGFRDGKYDGEGILYDGSRLQYRGTFLAGSPGPVGSLYNAQGQLLYSGPVSGGQVDYVALPGLPLAKIREYAMEVPSIYYGDGQVGFLYRELGFAVVTSYDYTGYTAPDSPDLPDRPVLGGEEALFLEAFPEPGPKKDVSLFSVPEDNLVANLLLVEGYRAARRIPADGVPAQERALDGFAAFMASRVKTSFDPMAAARFPARVEKEGDHLYYVTGLSGADYGKLNGVFKETLYYLWPAGENSKGSPSVVVLGKAKFGG